MASKDEKSKRNKILEELRISEAKKFEDSLPMSRDKFEDLFDYLDTELGENGCDDTNTLTKSYLNEIGIKEPEIDKIISWLEDKGGYCDCEILANVEEHFE